MKELKNQSSSLNGDIEGKQLRSKDLDDEACAFNEALFNDSDPFFDYAPCDRTDLFKLLIANRSSFNERSTQTALNSLPLKIKEESFSFEKNGGRHETDRFDEALFNDPVPFFDYSPFDRVDFF